MYIKFVSLFLFCSLSTISCYCQKEGFKDLKIEHKFYDTNLLDVYTYFKHRDDSSLYRLIPKSEQLICDDKVDYLEIKINSDSTIDFIEVYTTQVFIKDVNEFFDNYKSLINCTINTVGKPSKYESGNNDKYGRTSTTWLLDKNIVLAIYGKSPSVIDKNIKNYFKIVWFKYVPKKMW